LVKWAASRPDRLRSSSGKLAETDPRGRRIQRSVERAFVNGTAVAARDFEDGQRQQNKGVRIRDNRKP